jgi:hypothetical protein
MREYLESNGLQSIVARFFARNQPVGAICHGVLLAARSRGAKGRSVLYGKRTTALTKFMELTAWALTRLYLGDYYRTYSTTVEDEVRAALAAPEHFIRGPISINRDSPVVISQSMLGDFHRFRSEFFWTPLWRRAVRAAARSSRPRYRPAAVAENDSSRRGAPRPGPAEWSAPKKGPPETERPDMRPYSV